MQSKYQSIVKLNPTITDCLIKFNPQLQCTCMVSLSIGFG